MRIASRSREVTMAEAVATVVSQDNGTKAMLTRLLEELASSGTLRPVQLARVLAYQFEVSDDNDG